MNSPDELPFRETVKAPVEWLVLDPENPRFTPGKMPTTFDDEGIIRNLDREADLRELLQSISSSGYIDVEPMIVLLKGSRLIVLEGNRRLAAVKCLLNPDLAADAGIQVAEISDRVRQTLEKIPVYRVERREDALEIIGFKHINGPRPWDAFAKAEFAANWLAKETAEVDGLTLREIAERMGDNNNTLRRMVHAIFVLRQAASSDVWTIDDRSTRNFAFSHLYTGLSYASFSEFLGLEQFGRGEDPRLDPVPEEKLDELGNLLSWLYGDSRTNEDPIIETQAKDLGRIRQVLTSREATTQLITQRDLENAFVTAQPKGELFRKYLFDSKSSLEKALGAVGGFDATVDADLQQISEEIARSSRRLNSIVFDEIRAQSATNDGEA